MTPLECLQHLMACTGDCEADPELKEACADLGAIIRFYPVLLKSQEANIAGEQFATSMLPLMRAAAKAGGNEKAISILEKARRAGGVAATGGDDGHLLSAEELNQRLIEIGRILRGEKEDEPSKKQPSSCLSCRFHHTDADRIFVYCKNEDVNRCFRNPIYLYPESTKEYGFSCSFYEFKLDFDERFEKQGRVDISTTVDGGSGCTGNMPPVPMTR